MTRQTTGAADDLRLAFGQAPGSPPAAEEMPRTMPNVRTSTVRTESPAASAMRAGLKAAIAAGPKSFDDLFGEPSVDPQDVEQASGGVLHVPAAQPVEVLATQAATAPIADASAASQLWGPEPPPFAYLAGAAGCGKTFLTRQWAEEYDGVELVATTGIAAINLGGTTINSLLGYFDTKSLQEKYIQGTLCGTLGRLWRAGVRQIALDEVSMLDGDQLTHLVRGIEEVNTKDYVLSSKQDRAHAEQYGAPQMKLLLIGDFAQLPPVEAPFAFESEEWAKFAAPGHTITLTEVRRQADQDFIQALRAARLGDAGAVVDFFGGGLQATTDDDYPGVTLMAKNESVDRYNRLRLDRVQGREILIESARDGEQRSEWGNPNKPAETWGIPVRLRLKVGALVMILANKKVGALSNRFEYVNGDLGVVEDSAIETVAVPQGKGRPPIDLVQPVCYVRLQRTGEVVRVVMVRREKTQPIDAGRRKELREQGLDDRITAEGKAEIVGWVEYMPLRIAYATTVHKCVSGETRIPVIGRGYIPIATVVPYDMTPYGQVQAVARTEREAWRITTARGYTVIASAEHRWRTREAHLVETQELTTDDLLLHTGVPFPGQPDLPETTLWWLGLTVGDGCYTDRREGQIHLACMDRELGDRYKEIGEAAFGIAVVWRKDRRGLYLTSKGIRAKLAGWGLDYVKGPHKRVPRCVWTEGPIGRGAFLRGLFDADGYIGRNRVVLTTASEKMGEDVQELLLTLGVVSTRRHFPNYWQVYVGAESLDAFAYWVGFWKADKALKMTKARPNRVLRPSLGYDRVVKVEPLGVTVPMYDVEITAPHLLPFGPFLGHNSQGLSLDHVQVSLGDHFFKTPGMLYVALSRCRTAAGLRLVGSSRMLAERCTVHPKLVGRFL